MKVDLELDVDDIKTLKADDRGRVTIGNEFSGETVRVAVIEVKDDD